MKLLVLLLALAWTTAAVATESGIAVASLFPGATFDARIPTQEQLLGFAPGARPMRHGELLRFLEALDEASPRAALQPYAETYEGRKLVVFAVSDEPTMAGLEEFRRSHATRTDPRGRPPAQDRALLEPAKAVAWMAYGIHGDELSSVDAAAALAYWLVAGEDERARSLRRELVILIDPIENPDGRERFLAQTTAFAHSVPNPDSEDLSHTTVWPWGRGNHYLFDLNRDWFSMTQPESRRSAVIASWNPQLVVDSHEMGSDDSYLFSPPRHPFNPHLPGSHRRWWDRFAADQARALDARGYAYYTGEWNEEFFPGYGSSWAAYRGAVGILYEMSSTEGTRVRQRAGTERTYAQAVEHQVASSVANLETLAGNRLDLLLDFVANRREAIVRAGQGPLGAWILPEGRNPERTRRLVRLLRQQGIDVLRAKSEPPRIGGLRDARTGASIGANELSRPTWMVPADQPTAPLARVLLDPHVPMDRGFLREEREYIERGKGSRLYDVTAWSLPLAFGIEAYWTPERPSSGFGDDPLEEPAGQLDAGDPGFAYLMEGTSDESVFAVADMLARGLSVRIAEKPFRTAGRAFDRGAVLIKREGNPPDLRAQLAAVAEKWRVRFDASATAKSEDGPDLGGGMFRPLVAPRVGMWSGTPVSPSAYGAVWHLLDRQMGIRFSGLDLASFSRADLARYNVLIFPPMSVDPAAFRELAGEAGLERLKSWIAAGGTAIGIGSGAEFLADEKSGLTRTRLRRQALERYPPVVLGLGAEEAEAAGPFRATGLRPPRQADSEEGEGGSARAKGEPKRPPEKPPRQSAYDVAPLLGPGARPFAPGDLGTPAPPEPVSLADWLEPLLPAGEEEPDKDVIERADARLREFAPRGAFVRIDIDPEQWLAWGLPAELPALALARDALVVEPPVQVPARFADPERLHLGGLLWPEAAGRLARTAYVTREELGRGQVILFLSEPEFRGWTLGTRRLLLNAILYGPGLGTRWSTPW